MPGLRMAEDFDVSAVNQVQHERRTIIYAQETLKIFENFNYNALVKLNPFSLAQKSLQKWLDEII